MEHSILSPEELLNRINKIEQTRLGYFPTPLEAWERLRTHLDHSGTLLCKRDDQSGLAFGGNKVRQLEFLLGDAMQQGADTIVFAALSQNANDEKKISTRVTSFSRWLLPPCSIEWP